MFHINNLVSFAKIPSVSHFLLSPYPCDFNARLVKTTILGHLSIVTKKGRKKRQEGRRGGFALKQRGEKSRIRISLACP